MNALGSFSRRFLLLISVALTCLALSMTGCAANKAKLAAKPSPTQPTTLNQKKVNDILKTAFSQIGNPYRYGGSSPETGFDCSGFVGWVYGQYGVSLPRSSRDMLAKGDPIEIEELRPGDLVFFNFGYSHVGIYTGNDKLIHSPRTGKRVEEVQLGNMSSRGRYLGARRIIDNFGVTAISENLKEEWIKQSRHQAALAMNEAAAIRHTGSAAASAGKPSSRATASKTAPKSVIHKVVSGDNLVTLARRYGVTTADIVAANRLRNRDSLKPGQKLNIPTKNAQVAGGNAKPRTEQASARPAPTKPAAARTSTASASSGRAASSSSKRIVHKVVSGDNLVTLARRYGVTTADIVAANSLTDSDKLKLGQQLIVPDKSRVVASAKNAGKPAAKPKKPAKNSVSKPKGSNS